MVTDIDLMQEALDALLDAHENSDIYPSIINRLRERLSEEERPAVIYGLEREPL